MFFFYLFVLQGTYDLRKVLEISKIACISDKLSVGHAFSMVTFWWCISIFRKDVFVLMLRNE